MARSPAEKAAETVKDAAAAAQDSLAGSEAERLHGQIADLQKDLARIVQSLADLGANQGATIADTVKAEAQRIYAQGEAMAGRAEDGVEEARAYVQANPLKSLGIAAGLGLLFGLLLGRR
ncbi:DUF883 family protein [Gemmobacter fulvus]|uniref:DUF883 family protein n=1 Tax=Gemmobacter fulvus TaxID=2840474 RepID=A0A975S0H3_9RHOB|nr:DUF883 family protein [Gemmobacter fulvus]MBT9247214.1 DUF883 family protein [Gemmobacter fulvus]QWK88913.1 DUF883 family protein [Gemmobacter fulvus]